MPVSLLLNFFTTCSLQKHKRYALSFATCNRKHFHCGPPLSYLPAPDQFILMIGVCQLSTTALL